MNKFKLYTAIIASVAVLVSCKPNSSLQKDIKHMQLHFKPLTRADFTLVGNLETQITISGKMTRQGKTLDKTFAKNLKVGMYRQETTEMLYFAPGQNEVITGSLYDNEIFNTVYGSSSVGARPNLFRVLFGGLKAKLAAAQVDHGLNFGYFALIEKYPDIDYFINVRFDRKYILSGKKWTETVIVKADGVKLRTD